MLNVPLTLYGGSVQNTNRSGSQARFKTIIIDYSTKQITFLFIVEYSKDGL